jgi:hypothetical protein
LAFAGRRASQSPSAPAGSDGGQRPIRGHDVDLDGGRSVAGRRAHRSARPGHHRRRGRRQLPAVGDQDPCDRYTRARATGVGRPAPRGSRPGRHRRRDGSRAWNDQLHGRFQPIFATYRQHHTEDSKMARVLTAWTITTRTATAVATAVWSVLASLTTTRTAIMIAGVLLLVTSLILPWRRRSLPAPSAACTGRAAD